MKKLYKTLSVALTLAVTLLMLGGCGGTGKTSAQDTSGSQQAQNQSAGQATDTGSGKAKLEKKDGLLTYTDTKNSPFVDSGLRIEIKTGADGYAKFVKTDTKGNDTKDYYNFDFTKNQVEKYAYISAMGTAYYYIYDLKAGELAKMEDDSHQDISQKTKDSGRWDSAATKTASEVKSLQDYFQQQFGKSIADAAQGK